MTGGAPSETARPVEPRLAATLLLVRDAATGPEVLMMRRHDGSSFAAGAMVFPGGAVQAEDSVDDLRAACRSIDALGSLATAAIAAIRETFEECGILLARRAATGALVGGAYHGALVERYQTAVAHEPAAWLAMIRAEGLELACDLLVRYAHWITPASRPKRFDTHFFLAPAPPDQTASHDQREAVEADWLLPAAVVAGADDGRYRLVFATRMNLVKLAASATVEAALAAARVAPIVTVTPRMEKTPDGTVLRIPLEAGYGIESMPADNIPRA